MVAFSLSLSLSPLMHSPLQNLDPPLQDGKFAGRGTEAGRKEKIFSLGEPLMTPPPSDLQEYSGERRKSGRKRKHEASTNLAL